MFYERLLALCSERDIRITNLVTELQISSGNLSKWKAGNNPKSETLLKIADFFDVSTDYLLGRTDEKEKPTPVVEDGLDDMEYHLIALYRELNQEGQELLLDTADTMVSSGKYKKSGAIELG